eukprot:gene12410-16644_t
MADEDEEGSGDFNFDDISDIDNIDDANHLRLNADDDPYEGECGYSLFKALRGNSTGRKLKRNFFMFGVGQFLCGLPLMIITIQEGQNLNNIPYFETAPYGATLLTLMWLVCFPTMLMSMVSLLAVKYWASLTTNRALLGNLIRMYLGAFLLIFMFTLWCICATMLTFRKVKSWTDNVELAIIWPYYICTLLFIYPYIGLITIYVLNISGILEELDHNGNIKEPDPPEVVMDLTDVTISQSCLLIIVFPCVAVIQCMDLVKAIQRAYRRYQTDRLHGFNNNNSRESKKKKKGFLRKVYRTLTYCFKKPKSWTTQYQKSILEIEDLDINDPTDHS